MILKIPDIPPSPNKLRGVHWAVKKRLVDYWKSLIRAEIVPNGKCVCKRLVRITLHHAREFDQDNYYACVKPILDALKHWGLIYDDSPKWIALTVTQEHEKHKARHTTIEIT